MRQLTEQSLTAGLDETARRCPAVARALAEAGYPELRRREPGFAALLRAFVGHQLSVDSAGAIWGRLEAAVRPVAPGALLALDEDALRALGLSGPKIRYARALAEGCESGALDLDRLEGLPDEDAVAALVAVKGIGRWTAEVYLLFALGRRDVLPAGDLALLTAAQRLFGLPERPAPGGLLERAEIWRPWRGAVAHLLWRYFSETRPARRSGGDSLPV
ncbi:MAG: DNA-3-methyladenine glycosylase 2 family protein [Rhodospirillaceae bacterium]|nr:DNA-3-methyladenine glycosylase 2 family protein [Rhodospirillaceae bacterium]